MSVFLYILFFILGLCLGSFINAWLWRIHEGLPVWQVRSMCPKCKQKIGWHYNVPVFSYIFLLGKCRLCKQNISWQYPIVELSTALLFVFAAAKLHLGIFGVSTLLVRYVGIIFFLVCVFIYDLKYQEILDRFTTIPGAILLILSLLLRWNSVESLAAGIFVGVVFFLAQYLFSKGRWVGGGDIRMGFLMGAILGSPLIILALFLAYIIGAVAGIALILFKKKSMKSEVPFGVFLSFATMVTMFYGKNIIQWYIGFIR